MAIFQLIVNGQRQEVEVDPDTPLLWVLRDTLGLTGTKYGCGIMQCGACTVRLDGVAQKTCVLPVSAVGERAIQTIEGLGERGQHPVQEAWIKAQVPQCGYCQSGQIMTAAALFEQNSEPSDEDIERAMREVLCRCGTYPRVRRALAGLRDARRSAAAPAPSTPKGTEDSNGSRRDVGRSASWSPAKGTEGTNGSRGAP